MVATALLNRQVLTEMLSRGDMAPHTSLFTSKRQVRIQEYHTGCSKNLEDIFDDVRPRRLSDLIPLLQRSKIRRTA